MVGYVLPNLSIKNGRGLTALDLSGEDVEFSVLKCLPDFY